MLVVLLKPIYLIAIFVVVLVLFALIFSFIFSKKFQTKLRGYRHEIARSHSQILKLEVKNQHLAQRISELEQSLMLKKTA